MSDGGRRESASFLAEMNFELAASAAEVLSCGLSTRGSARNRALGTARVTYGECHRPYRQEAPATNCDIPQVRKIHSE